MQRGNTIRLQRVQLDGRALCDYDTSLGNVICNTFTCASVVWISAEFSVVCWVCVGRTRHVAMGLGVMSSDTR